MLKQVTVFLENAHGRLAAMCKTLADANINLTALTIADTASFGVVRMLVDDPQKAVDALTKEEYRAQLVEVSAVEIPNVPGSLAALLAAFDEANHNIEYAYCFASDDDKVALVFRVEEPDRIAEVTEPLGYRLVTPEDL